MRKRNRSREMMKMGGGGRGEGKRKDAGKVSHPVIRENVPWSGY
jgi:hypothetical protein